MTETNLVSKFKVLGFSENQSNHLAKVDHLYAQLLDALPASDIAKTKLDSKRTSNITFYSSIQSKAKANCDRHQRLVIQLIVNSRLKSTTQIEAAHKFLNEVDSANFDFDRFKTECGIDIEISDSQIEEIVRIQVSKLRDRIIENWRKVFSTIMTNVRSTPILKWADPARIKACIDKEIQNIVSSCQAQSTVKPLTSSSKQEKSDQTTFQNAIDNLFLKGFLGSLHKVGENEQINPKRMAEHLVATEGKIITRFPPEPNGHLHIGHSKALMINFGFAQYYNGKCILRYDDTNPEAEDDIFVQSIKESVKWLGYTPFKITYSSDYFDELYRLAEELIKIGKAYVDHSTDEDINLQRGGANFGERYESKWRNRPIDENLRKFRAMRDGEYRPKEAILRMKQDLKNGNPQMWDLTAYRILESPHHRTGNKWRIYPTYDFTHCLVDSLENITHSLCTTEFRLSRESYEWLCNTLDVYCPAQREYFTSFNRANRKINELVKHKVVRGWDDPRLYTLNALRRRGVPPGAILSFVCEVGVTASDSIIQLERFETCIRKYLEFSVPRVMMLLDPICVYIENLPDDFLQNIELPFSSKDPGMGSRKVPFTNRIYIDRSDFREIDSPDYYRLAPNKSVGLFKVEYPITCVTYTKDNQNRVISIQARYEKDSHFKKPKTYIQWIAKSLAHSSPVLLKEVRQFSKLFKSEKPALTKSYLDDVNPESEIKYENAMIEVGIKNIEQLKPWPKEKALSGSELINGVESVRFQALRLGYYCMDQDSTDDAIVLNRIVTLREDLKKQ